MLPCPLGRSWASFFFGQGTQSRHPQMGLSPNKCSSFGELLLYFCSLHLVDGQSEGGNPQSRSNICGSITTLLLAYSRPEQPKEEKKVPNSNAFWLRLMSVHPFPLGLLSHLIPSPAQCLSRDAPISRHSWSSSQLQLSFTTNVFDCIVRLCGSEKYSSSCYCGLDLVLLPRTDTVTSAYWFHNLVG